MDNTCQPPTENVVCYCTGTTETKIKSLLATGLTTLEDVINYTGATTGCGGCDYDVAALIEQHKS